jgi:LPS-assembly protein
MPDDKMFRYFQHQASEEFAKNPDPRVQANLRHLMNASNVRKGFGIQNQTSFDSNWSSKIDYSYVSDDFYPRDIGHTLTEPTNNQLLQMGEITYLGRHWNFTGRVQAYQTLHPVDDKTTLDNQYAKFPQLILAGEYPEQKFGLTYTILNDLTHFDIHNTPNVLNPIGNRLHIQPGVSLPFNLPYFYVTPRIQWAFTHYDLGHVSNGTYSAKNRSVPITDIMSGLYFDRATHVFGQNFKQTLEPQLYYVNVPYRNQNRFPLFDTTTNSVTYDQLFTYNRFTGFDRLGDTNQISAGLSTRYIDTSSGLEKLRIAVGEVFYFGNRRVNLCSMNSLACPDPFVAKNNRFNRSPIATTIDYHLTPHIAATANSVWNTRLNTTDNESVTFQYSPESQKIFNLGYSFVRNGDIQPNLPAHSNQNNLKQTDFSIAWPIRANFSYIGRWTQNINQGHFQNLLTGLQYDSCCWAVRVVYGKSFLNLRQNNSYQYDTQFYVQFALKGLTNVGTGDPSILINNSVPSYRKPFGNELL